MSKMQSKLRVGVIGVGMGRQHVKRYQESDRCEVVALCDIDEARLAGVAEMLDVPQTYTDAQKMLDAAKLDVVSVATPNTLHHPLTMMALDAGLHVLCEKPMAMNAAQAKEMVDKAKTKQRKLAIHYNHRMQPSVQFLKRYAASGEMGEIYFARTTWHRRRGIPGRASFLDKAHSGGGCLIDLGVHMLDQTLYIMGYPKVAAVSAGNYRKFDKKYVPDIPMSVEDFSVSLLRLEGGGCLAMEISWASHHDHPEQMIVQLYGTEAGGLRWSEQYQDQRTSIHRVEHDGLVTVNLDRPTKVTSVQADFIDAIADGREPECTGEQGWRTMQVLDAIYESSEKGAEVKVR